MASAVGSCIKLMLVQAAFFKFSLLLTLPVVVVGLAGVSSKVTVDVVGSTVVATAAYKSVVKQQKQPRSSFSNKTICLSGTA